MVNAALRYRDCSELYITPYSGETIKYLNSFKGQILFPNEDMPSAGNYTAHTYGTNANEFPFTESDTINPGYHTFLFSLDKSQLKFRPYNEYIEFSLVSFGEDKRIFTEYAPANRYSNTDVLDETREEQAKYEATPRNYRIAKIVILLTCIFITIFVLRHAFTADKKMNEKYTFYKPSMSIDYFRDIPSNLDPLFASTLAFCKGKSSKNMKDGYAAILLSLARKEYIELAKIDETKDWITSNVKIVIKPSPTPIYSGQIEGWENLYSTTIKQRESLTLTEELYYNLIIRHSKGYDISLADFQNKVSKDIENTDSFVRNIEKSTIDIGISQGYFQKAAYEEPKNNLKSWSTFYGVVGTVLITLINFFLYFTRLDFAYGAFFILGIAMLVNCVYLRKIAKKYILLTQFGEDEYVKWKGLYDFLNSNTLINERTVIELPIWEQYLVYATAFGISEKVIKALNIRCPEANTSPILSNPYYRSVNFYHSGRIFRHTVRTASYSARSGSYGGGFGGHGGYGGGGRGGGGGRRRTLKYGKILYLFKKLLR